MRKIICVLFALLLVLGMTACGEPVPEQTQPETTEATEPPETIEATRPVIDNPQALIDALTVGGVVELEADVTMTETPVVYGGEFNGNGHTITGPAYAQGNVNTENGLSVVSGTVRDVTITGAYRCIGDSELHRRLGQVRLYNVTVDGDSYALNFGYGRNDDKLIAEGCHFYGWSSYTGFSEALFTDCTFGWDATGSQGNLRPYNNTTLIGCHFEGKTDENGNAVPFNIHFKAGSDGITLTLEDCYVGDTLITEENLHTLLSVSQEGNRILVFNTQS